MLRSLQNRLDHSSKKIVLITASCVFIFVLGLAFFVHHQHRSSIPEFKGPIINTINTDDQPTLSVNTASEKSPRIHIIVFEDLKCTNCALFNNHLFPQIQKKYIATGIADYTFYNLAFIPGSLPAANAARCLYAQNKNYFFPFISYIYQNQPPEQKNWASMALLLQFAKNAVPEANIKQLSECIIEGRYNRLLHNNFKYAKILMHGKPATPTVYINGRILNDFSMREIDRLVQTALKEQRPIIVNTD